MKNPQLNKVGRSILEPSTPKPSDIYRHHKGNMYMILPPVFDGETGELMVMYQGVTISMIAGDMYTLFGRAYVHTMENFMKPGRFEKVENWNNHEEA